MLQISYSLKRQTKSTGLTLFPVQSKSSGLFGVLSNFETNNDGILSPVHVLGDILSAAKLLRPATTNNLNKVATFVFIALWTFQGFGSLCLLKVRKKKTIFYVYSFLIQTERLKFFYRQIMEVEANWRVRFSNNDPVAFNFALHVHGLLPRNDVTRSSLTWNQILTCWNKRKQASIFRGKILVNG